MDHSASDTTGATMGDATSEGPGATTGTAPSGGDAGGTARPSVWVRRAVPTDSDALIRLLEEIMAHHGVTPPPPDALRSTIEETFASTSHEFLVAGVTDRVLGMCALIYSLSTWSAGPVCELQDVVVAPASRAERVGTALLTAAERRARERGCLRMFLSAETANLGGHAFYRSLRLTEKAVLHFERDLTLGARGDAAPDGAASAGGAASGREFTPDVDGRRPRAPGS